MATLDATTQAEYAAEVNAADRAQVIVDALADPVYGRVYDSEGALMGEGVMTSPWAVASGDTVTVATLDGFFVSDAVAVNDGWYFRMESGTRYVSFSFGLAGSAKEAAWSLDSWSIGTRAGIASGVITVTGNRPPAWSGTPSTIQVLSGGTQDFSAYASDPDGDAISFSLVTPPSGYSISAGGTLTAGSTSETVTIRATDSAGLTADVSVSVLIAPQSGLVKWNPGHYAWPAVSQNKRVNTNKAAEKTFITSIGSNPYIRGVSLVKFWYYCEAAQGDYSPAISYIQEMLDHCAAQPYPKRLIFHVSEHAFGETSSVLPAYVIANGWSQSSDGSLSGGLTYWARTWINSCATAYLNCLKAIGAYFNDHPLFEMIGGGETAQGASTADATYSASGYQAFHQRIMDEVSPAAPRVLVRYSGNFAPTTTIELAWMQYLHNRALAGRNLICGGPDPELPLPVTGAWNEGKRPWTNQLFRGLTIDTSKVYQDLRGIVPWVGEQQYLGFQLPGYTQYNETPTEIDTYQYGTMRASHMIWVSNEAYGSTAQRWSTGILPYINSIAGRTVTTVPSTLAGRTITGGV